MQVGIAQRTAALAEGFEYRHATSDGFDELPVARRRLARARKGHGSPCEMLSDDALGIRLLAHARTFAAILGERQSAPASAPAVYRVATFCVDMSTADGVLSISPCSPCC